MKRASSLPITRGGILQLSTWIILAGSTLTLTSCDSSERKARQAQANYESESKRLIAELDDQRDQLLSGQVPNNFRIDDVGYYHAASHDFYEHSYNHQRDGKWFVNNTWAEAPGPEDVPASRPSPEALKRVDDALAKQQQQLDATAEQAAQYQNQSHASHGPGLGTALAMYWLLSGNRGSYSPGPGFASFGQRAPLFESNYRRQRDDQARTSSYSYGGGSTSSSRTSTSGSSYGSRSSTTTSSSGGSDSHPSSSTGSHASSSTGSSSSSSGTHSSSSSSPSSRGGFGSSGGSSSSSS